jgi:hypothetical protein
LLLLLLFYYCGLIVIVIVVVIVVVVIIIVGRCADKKSIHVGCGNTEELARVKTVLVKTESVRVRVR